jgi:hypothetical protein
VRLSCSCLYIFAGTTGDFTDLVEQIGIERRRPPGVRQNPHEKARDAGIGGAAACEVINDSGDCFLAAEAPGQNNFRRNYA